MGKIERLLGTWDEGPSKPPWPVVDFLLKPSRGSFVVQLLGREPDQKEYFSTRVPWEIPHAFDCLAAGQEDENDDEEYQDEVLPRWLTDIAALLRDQTDFRWKEIRSLVVGEILGQLRAQEEVQRVHRLLFDLVRDISDVFNAKWVVGKGECGKCPDLNSFEWPRTNRRRDAEGDWEEGESGNFGLDEKDDWLHPKTAYMAKAALKIDWDANVAWTKAVRDFEDLAGIRFDFDERPEFWHYAMIRTDPMMGGSPYFNFNFGDDKERASAIWEHNDDWEKLCDLKEKIVEDNLTRLGLDFEAFFKKYHALYPERGYYHDFDRMVADRQAVIPRDLASIGEECLFDIWEGYFGTAVLLQDVYAELRQTSLGLTEFLAPTGAQDFSTCCLLLREIELDLRQIVCRCLENQFGKENAWENGVPQSIKKGTARASRQKDRSPWASLSVRDLHQIATGLWKRVASFGEVFRSGVLEVDRRLEEFCKVRNRVFHPESEEEELKDEAASLKELRQWVKSASSRMKTE